MSPDQRRERKLFPAIATQPPTCHGPLQRLLDGAVIALFRNWRTTIFPGGIDAGAQIHLAIAGGIPRFGGANDADVGAVRDSDLVRSATGVSRANSLEVIGSYRAARCGD